jgi:hypothetical protein
MRFRLDEAHRAAFAEQAAQDRRVILLFAHANHSCKRRPVTRSSEQQDAVNSARKADL